jgi:hypothetical protein
VILSESVYSDDAAVLITPTEKDMSVTKASIQTFADATGLITNMSKTQYFLIQYSIVDLGFLTRDGKVVSSFSTTYMGLPLNIRKPTRSTMQPLI